MESGERKAEDRNRNMRRQEDTRTKEHDEYCLVDEQEGGINTHGCAEQGGQRTAGDQ